MVKWALAGKVCAWVGLVAAGSTYLVVLFKIAKCDPLVALLALVYPSGTGEIFGEYQNKRPLLFAVWLLGIALIIFGGLTLAVLGSM